MGRVHGDRINRELCQVKDSVNKPWKMAPEQRE